MNNNSDDVRCLQQFIDDTNFNLQINYAQIKDVFVLKYGYPELDPLRNEICKCIICGLFQAAITLTNHLLEKSLKFCLIIKYTKETKKEETLFDTIFEEGLLKYDKSDLEQTINQACSQGLITKEQKKILIQFKRRFRNPYSHATTDIYKDTFARGKMMSVDDLTDGLESFMRKCFDESLDTNISLKKNLIAQGFFQVPIAKANSVPYFRNVDLIIREMLLNLK